ncbi:MAG: hypothetical protein ASARMPRED_000287 [Alectoria sarmentosa]|nr:MAG: hypothetical protein ASARMPRED_000287 [Alectoria sarmentosa]
MARPTVWTIAEEAPCTILPTKSSDFDWPKEKATVDAAKAISPQSKANERREPTRSYKETSPVRGKQDTNPSLHIVFVKLYPFDQSKRQDWDYEGIEIGVGWKRTESVSRVGTTSAWNVQTEDG